MLKPAFCAVGFTHAAKLMPFVVLFNDTLLGTLIWELVVPLRFLPLPFLPVTKLVVP